MDRCPHCHMRMKPVLAANGRTEFQCAQCERTEPVIAIAVKRVETPLPSKAA